MYLCKLRSTKKNFFLQGCAVGTHKGLFVVGSFEYEVKKFIQSYSEV